MSTEPGTCDVTTTAEDRPDSAYEVWQERTPDGWMLRHDRVGSLVHTRVYAPLRFGAGERLMTQCVWTLT